jgi:leucyl aminopeptidase
MDITATPELGSLKTLKKSPRFPQKPVLQEELYPLIKNLSKSNMQANLEKFSSFHTRYYKSDYGIASSDWLLKNVQTVIQDAGADQYGVYAKHFEHPWGQNSIIATVPGKSNSTVVVGAHQDSINLFLPSIFSAPGADDDGSGTVTILEAFRTLLTSPAIIEGKAENTVEFHWYSAEEGGLLGSQAIFKEYEQAGRDVKAMLQQDMTGYVQGTLDAGKEESVGVITDFVDPDLTRYIKEIVTEVGDLYSSVGSVTNFASTAKFRLLRQSAVMPVVIMHQPPRLGIRLHLLLNRLSVTRTRRSIPLMMSSST